MAREYPDISSFSLHKILDRSALAVRSLVERYGILLMIGSEGLFGGATANMLRRGRKGATAGTLMIGFYTRLLFGCLMRWWKTGNYL